MYLNDWKLDQWDEIQSLQNKNSKKTTDCLDNIITCTSVKRGKITLEINILKTLIFNGKIFYRSKIKPLVK